MANAYALAGEGAIWIQPNGPNTEPKYMGCHEMGDIDEPVGDIKLFYCPNPSTPNKWDVIGSVQGNPGPVSSSLITDILKTADYLESVRCPIPLFVHHVSCGRKDVFTSYDRSFLLKRTYITSRKLTKLTARSPENQDRSEQSFEIKAESLLRLFELKVVRMTTTDTDDMLAITSCDSEECAGDCGPAKLPCDTMYAGGGTLVGSALNTADLIYTDDGGSIWVDSGGNPFIGAEIIRAIKCFQLDRNTSRIIVACGTAGAGPMRIAYSDNQGATWTLVTVGTLNGQYAIGPKALYIKNQYEIWLACTDGYVYFSGDGGATWTAQTAGGLTTEDLSSVMLVGEYGFAAGDNNAILLTLDNGAIWTLVAGPAGQAADEINTIWVHDQNKVWLGYNDGTLWYTDDGGTNWYQRTVIGISGGTIKDMAWYDEYIGAFVYNNGSGVGSIYYTINGGYSWQLQDTPSNTGFNAIHVCSPTSFVIAGDTQGGTGVLLKMFGG